MSAPPVPLRPRVYSEDLPLERLAEARLLDALAARGVDLVAAIRPRALERAAELARACAGRGVRLVLWPMLDDAHGRWASVANASAFVAHALGLVDELAARGLRPAEVLVDLEPAFDAVRALVAGPRDLARALSALRAVAPGRADGPFLELARALASREIASSVAAVPLVLADGAHRRGWQELLGTPVDTPPWGHVSVMVYTSILEGWSRGLLRRPDARALLAEAARAALRRYGARAGVSLGAVATGALGDEPVYRDVSELRDDVAIVRACGVEAITLFDLRGALARPPAEAWLDALVETPPAATLPARTPRVLAALGAAAGSSGALGLLVRRRSEGRG